MRIPGVKTANMLLRWVRARVLGGALILGYHRVAVPDNDELEGCVTPQHFAEQMEVLGKFAHPFSLSALVQCLKDDSLPPRAVAVTFDDGYADNLFEAKPVLEKYEIPATVFICTGYAGREFWWDETERLVIASMSAIGELRLGEGKDQFAGVQTGMNSRVTSEERRIFLHALYDHLLSLDIEEQSRAMKSIRKWANGTSREATARALTSTEIRQLAGSGLIEIGAHTRHHPMLPRLSLERQREEILSGRNDLEELLGRRVDGFAYPNGRATGPAMQILLEAGFAFACTSLHDVVRPSTDRYELTRFWQRNVDGDDFLRDLRLWMKDGQV